ncbi:hypothetical protein [Klebsiella pneumoniae]|uniref:hypothetical protein n=1 Tax=Klebsiella pneumoniae TaxID=573 RepID=UPI000E3B88E0
MPSEPVCIGKAYADGEDMRMSDLCRCRAYGYALHIYSSLFSRSDPKKGCSGSLRTPPARSGPETQDVAVSPADSDPICCVPPLPRDRLLTTGKRRFAYSLTVVHFRKVVIRKKFGSAGNGHPVI